MFISFKTQIEKQLGKSILAVQSDNEGACPLKNYLSTNGIAHWRACPHAHQQMGVVDIGMSLIVG